MKKIFLILLLVIMGVASFFVIRSVVHSKKQYNVQKEIASNIIRFHVRANSDSKEDQQLKLAVKDSVVQYLEKRMEGVESLDEARKILYDDSDSIKRLALDVIRGLGYGYDVRVYFSKEIFPLKEYGDMSFPPGEYEAFRVDIGDSEGRNWWCVLFPPLCFVDSACSIVPEDSKEIFRNYLSDEAYSAITLKSLRESDCKIRFRYLKFLNKLFE